VSVSVTSLYSSTVKPADVWQFVEWLVEVGEVEGLSSKHLWNLYQEFAEVLATRPLSKGRLFVLLKGTCVERYREGAGKRRWLYRVSRRRLETSVTAVEAVVRAGRWR
jgi:hypothetical protein